MYRGTSTLFSFMKNVFIYKRAPHIESQIALQFSLLTLLLVNFSNLTYLDGLRQFVYNLCARIITRFLGWQPVPCIKEPIGYLWLDLRNWGLENTPKTLDIVNSSLQYKKQLAAHKLSVPETKLLTHKIKQLALVAKPETSAGNYRIDLWLFRKHRSPHMLSGIDKKVTGFDPRHCGGRSIPTRNDYSSFKFCHVLCSNRLRAHLYPTRNLHSRTSKAEIERPLR